jgi:hypothetical protein
MFSQQPRTLLQNMLDILAAVLPADYHMVAESIAQVALAFRNELDLQPNEQVRRTEDGLMQLTAHSDYVFPIFVKVVDGVLVLSFFNDNGPQSARMAGRLNIFADVRLPARCSEEEFRTFAEELLGAFLDYQCIYDTMLTQAKVCWGRVQVGDKGSVLMNNLIMGVSPGTGPSTWEIDRYTFNFEVKQPAQMFDCPEFIACATPRARNIAAPLQMTTQPYFYPEEFEEVKSRAPAARKKHLFYLPRNRVFVGDTVEFNASARTIESIDSAVMLSPDEHALMSEHAQKPLAQWSPKAQALRTTVCQDYTLNACYLNKVPSNHFASLTVSLTVFLTYNFKDFPPKQNVGSVRLLKRGQAFLQQRQKDEENAVY